MSAMKIFRDMRKGQFLADISEALKEVTAGAVDTRKAGKVTITIEVTPIKSMADAFNVSDKIKADVPRHKPEGSLMFGTIDGKLSLEHPAQTSIFDAKDKEENDNVG